MKKYLQYIIVLLLIITSFGGCRSISKYTIDKKPLIKIDTGLFGIWKAAEDTDKRNFILIQNLQNVYPKHKISDLNPASDEVKNRNYDYYITYMDHRGKNPHYQQWTVFLSRINKTTFLNIPYRYAPTTGSGENFSVGKTTNGFFFVRLIKISAAYDTLTTALVADSTLIGLKSPGEVRNRIEKNRNNPAFYSDTLHFYKVSNYHLSLNESINRAN